MSQGAFIADLTEADFVLAIRAHDAYFQACPAMAKAYVNLQFADPERQQRWVAGVRAILNAHRETRKKEGGRIFYEAWVQARGMSLKVAPRFADLGRTGRVQFRAAAAVVVAESAMHFPIDTE